MSSLRLICFTRYPRAGATKTRLIPALGEAGAAALQAALVEHLLAKLHTVNERGWELELRFAGDKAQMRSWLGPEHRMRNQGCGDLGERMLHAFEDARAECVEKALLFGTDIPDLEVSHLEHAAHLLDTHDVVFGPATDGGYYLVGLKRPQPVIFEAMPWSTDQVLNQSESLARAAGLTVARIAALCDVDRPEDLARLHHHAKLRHFVSGVPMDLEPGPAPQR